jgi:hypothetical protein
MVYEVDISVSIATGWTAQVQFLAAQDSSLLQSVLTSLLSNEYRGLFPRGYSNRGVKLTTQIHLMQRSGMDELYLHSRVCLHGAVLRYLSVGTTLPLP